MCFASVSRLAFEEAPLKFNNNKSRTRWESEMRERKSLSTGHARSDILTGSGEFDLWTHLGGIRIEAEIISLIKSNSMHSHKVHFTQSKRTKERRAFEGMRNYTKKKPFINWIM